MKIDAGAISPDERRIRRGRQGCTEGILRTCISNSDARKIRAATCEPSMKDIIVAGRSGTRSHPITPGVSKHLLCILALLAAPIAAAQALNPKLLELPPNRWVKLHKPFTLWKPDWTRQGHAGMTYDSKRGTLLVFGSDTHGENWDNAIHEFDPVAMRWDTHFPESPKESYRADDKGRAIAGETRLQPWAMHTYSGVTYDPVNDGLVVAARPEHNPIGKQIPAVKTHPNWFYSQKYNAWEMLGETQPTPFFGAAAAFDERRGVAVAYRFGIWELLPTPFGRTWQPVTEGGRGHLHHSLVYDSLRGNFAVFGDYANSNEVWIYTPGARPGEAGKWEQRTPIGDPCPRDQHIPVAFDKHQGVFLLVPDNTPVAGALAKGQRPPPASSSSTFTYDPDSNRYTRLPDADLPPLGMNFMMAYDTRHKVFLLVTGSPEEAPTVWALKLNRPR